MRDSLAAEWLARVAAAYAAFDTYQDAGTSRSDVIEGDDLWPSHTSRIEFHSRFERSTGIVFTFRSFEQGPLLTGPEKDLGQGRIQQDRTGAETWSVLQGPVPVPGHELGVASRAHSLCAMTARLVSRLLLPGSGDSFALPPAKDAQVQGEEEIDGRRCVLVRGTSRAGQTTVVWIDAQTCQLLRRRDVSLPDERRQRALQEFLLMSESRIRGDPHVDRSLVELAARRFRPRRREVTTTWRAHFDVGTGEDRTH